MAAPAETTPLAREAWAMISELWLGERPRVMAAMTALGLHPVQGLALRALEPDEPRSMSALAAALHRDPSNITRIADRLEAAGLIERRPAAHDRRVKALVLTERGAELRRRIAEIWTAPPSAVASMPEEDLVALRDMLQRALGR